MIFCHAASQFLMDVIQVLVLQSGGGLWTSVNDHHLCWKPGKHWATDRNWPQSLSNNILHSSTMGVRSLEIRLGPRLLRWLLTSVWKPEHWKLLFKKSMINLQALLYANSCVIYSHFSFCFSYSPGHVRDLSVDLWVSLTSDSDCWKWYF